MNMRRITVASILLGLAAAVPSLAQNAPAAPPAAAPAQIGPARIGVINLDKIFQDLQEAKDIRAHQEADQTALRNLMQDHQTELARLKETRDKGLKSDSPQYEEATQELEKKSLSYESELKMKQLDMARSQNRLMKSVFEKVQDASTAVAKDKGLDLVISQIRPEFPPNLQEQNPDAIRQLIQQRTMIYVSPNIDITADVVTALDAAYKAANK